jgi:hypothetical protein
LIFFGEHINHDTTETVIEINNTKEIENFYISSKLLYPYLLYNLSHTLSICLAVSELILEIHLFIDLAEFLDVEKGFRSIDRTELALIHCFQSFA